MQYTAGQLFPLMFTLDDLACEGILGQAADNKDSNYN